MNYENQFLLGFALNQHNAHEGLVIRLKGKRQLGLDFVNPLSAIRSLNNSK